jgi:simple sugar transport system permease protein
MDPILILQYSTPVALAAVGETIGQRAGVINIGLEGCMLGGAFAGMVVTLRTGSPILGALAGLMVGLVLSLGFAWFTILRAIDQVVVGTAINLLALGVTGTLFRTQFSQSGSLLSVEKLPTILGRFDIVELFLLLVTPIAFGVLNYSSFGLALRAAGEYPKSAEAAGFSVIQLRAFGTAVSGALSGLAGAYLSLGISGSFAENMTSGRGFLAIAMVTFGRWNPIFVCLAALLIGTAESLQYAVQTSGIGVPYQLMIALPYLVALAVLVFVGKGTRAPAALAQPYVMEK